MRILFALLLCLLPATAIARDTPTVDEFPQLADQFATCSALYAALAEETASRKGEAAQKTVNEFRLLQRQAMFASTVYMQEAEIDIPDTHIDGLFHEVLEDYRAAFEMREQGGAEMIAESIGHCKGLLEIQQTLYRARPNSTITIHREGGIFF